MDTSEYAPEQYEELAGRIRAYRSGHGMTQRELAEQLGVTQQSVARWEQGSPPSRHMLRVVESLVEDVTPSEHPAGLADVIGIRLSAVAPPPARGLQEARKAYVQGCVKLLERGERLPNKVLLLLADELGWSDPDG